MLNNQSIVHFTTALNNSLELRDGQLFRMDIPTFTEDPAYIASSACQEAACQVTNNLKFLEQSKAISFSLNIFFLDGCFSTGAK
jgi:hypothetical protein